MNNNRQNYVARPREKCPECGREVYSLSRYQLFGITIIGCRECKPECVGKLTAKFHAGESAFANVAVAK